LAGQHQEVPVKIANILATATDAMSIRTQIGRMEIDALESSAEYLAARDELNAAVAAERQVTNDALYQVRTDPEFVALTQQLRSTQKAFLSRAR
jgi:hypothetical protein